VGAVRLRRAVKLSARVFCPAANSIKRRSDSFMGSSTPAGIVAGVGGWAKAEAVGGGGAEGDVNGVTKTSELAEGV
jgi:hypothetical protein